MTGFESDLTGSDAAGAAGNSQVAIYLDTDNLIIGLYEYVFGKAAWRDDNPNFRHRDRERNQAIRQRLEMAHLDVGAIMGYASLFGTITVSRAYANWAAPVNERYGDEMLRNSIDLVQLFPMTGHGKNGADIRMAIDVIEDLTRYPHITHVVLAAGDSDYMSLAQRCKRLGRQVVGIGIAGSSGRYFQLACDEFRFYHWLPDVTLTDITSEKELTPATVPTSESSSDEPGSDPAVLRALALRAAMLLAGNSSSEWMGLSQLKPQMRRLDPAFDERSLGFTSFKAFVASMPDVFQLRLEEQGHMSFRLLTGSAETESPVDDTAGIEPPTLPYPTSEVIGRLRQQLGGTPNQPFGTGWEAAAVAVMRSMWARLHLTPGERVRPNELVAADLIPAGHAGPDAKRAVHNVFTLLPALLHDELGQPVPNPELERFDDAQLTDRLRQAVAARLTNKSYPDRVEVTDALVALYGQQPVPEGAAETIARVLAVPPLAAMSEALNTQLLPPLVLWDYAAAVSALGSRQALGSMEDLAAAIGPQLTEVGRPVDHDQVTAAWNSMRNAGVLGSDAATAVAAGEGSGAEADDIAGAVIASWAETLHDANLFDSQEFTSLESFYRLTLPDHASLTRRKFVAARLRLGRIQQDEPVA